MTGAAGLKLLQNYGKLDQERRIAVEDDRAYAEQRVLRILAANKVTLP